MTNDIMELLEDKMRVWLNSAIFVKPISGVYVLYNKNKEVIYIGTSNNLEATFTKYVETDFEGNECLKKTQSYQREFIDNPKERQLELIEDFKRQTGNLPACNTEIELETC